MSSPTTAAEAPPRPARFLGLSLLALAALAFVAAQAPPRIKLIGLFPAAVGAAAGASMALLGEREAASRRTVITAAAILIPLAMAGYAAESYRLWRAAKAEEIAANLLAQPGGKGVLDDVLSGRPGANETEAEFLAVYRRRMAPPPAAYLIDRLKGSPVALDMPWAAVLAVGELMSGVAAGLLAATMLAKRPASGDNTPDERNP